MSALFRSFGLLKLFALLTIAAWATSASAEDNPQGFYAGAGYGQFDVSVDNVEDIADVIGDIDADDSAWKVFAGWRFNPYIAFEAAYIDLGNPGGQFEGSGSDGQYSLELAGFAPYLIGTLPLGIFELSAKVGYYFHDVDLSIDFDNFGPSNGDVVSSDDSAEAVVYGVGAGVTLIDHLNVKVEYELMDLDEFDDAYTLWLAAAWRF